MAKVYVSSTVADLRQERQAVTDWLVAAQHQVVHSYRPNSDTVRDSCVADVDTCDLYVLIQGHRYGFQPPKGNPEGLSITQLEFRRAGQCGKPRVALLRTSIPDVGLADIADPPRWARVQAFREEVAGAVRAAEFSDLRGLIYELSTGVPGELEKIQAEQEKIGAERATQPPASVSRALRLAPRPPFLAGREDLLADLDDRLGEGPRVVALHGLAGTGKTSVALAYAHGHLTEVGIAWQLPAGDATVLAAGFGELATALGAPAEAGDPVVAVHGALAAAAAEWLLVLDNAPDRASVERFLPPAGDGRVLITSRNALWPPGQAVEVPVLDLDAAAGFLTARTGDPDRRAAAGLAEAVGGLPLALEQAAAYIQATGDTLAGYLAAFHQRRADLLARGQARAPRLLRPPGRTRPGQRPPASGRPADRRLRRRHRASRHGHPDPLRRRPQRGPGTAGHARHPLAESHARRHHPLSGCRWLQPPGSRPHAACQRCLGWRRRASTRRPASALIMIN